MDNKSLMAKAIDLTIRNTKKNQSLKVEKFLRAFFERQEYPDVKRLGPEAVAKLLEEAWNVFYKRTIGEAKVDIYEIKGVSKSGNHRLIINCVNENMPFLVDSLVGYLSKMGLRARILLRPIMRVRRDREGKLEDIIPAGGPEKGTYQESFIHCEVTDLYTPDQFNEIKRDIPKVMRDVRLAVTDWHTMRSKVHDAIAAIKPVPGLLSSAQIAEVIDFLQWLNDDHFTFLGYREYALSEEDGVYETKATKSSHLGVLSHNENVDLGIFYRTSTLSPKTLHFIFQSSPLVVSKTTRVSSVHRPVPMDSITIKIYNKQGEVVGLRQFLGLFTSTAYSSSTRDIPLLRRKVTKIIEQAGFSPDWHDGKAMGHILNSLPRDELFQATEEELLSISLRILSIQERPRLAFFVRRDHFDRFLSCLIYVPKDRFEYSLTETFGEILSQEISDRVTLISAQYGGLTFARIHYMIALDENKKIDFDVNKIESLLVQSTHSWKDTLLLELMKAYGEWDGTTLYRKYGNAFKKGYQEHFTESEAVIDIDYIEKIFTSGDLGVRIHRPEGVPITSLKIKLYNMGAPVPLSDVIPVLEDMDLRVVGEVPFTLTPRETNSEVWVHDFETVSRGNCPIDIEAIEEKFVELFQRVHSGEVESDGFNRLVVRAGFDWRECMMLRAYCKHLRQLRIQFSQDYMEQTLVKNPGVTRVIRDLFIEKFNLESKEKDAKKCDELVEKISQLLIHVDNADDDLILRRFSNLIQATVRTNYFHKNKPYLTFKFKSGDIDEMPKPRPLYEIFVYSPRFEAVHLRGGKVARGGIRWSDRREDFRTEILGLVKAQMVKNAVIVPQGAKGGFALKASTQFMNREQFINEGVSCYKLMIHALLELTDNLVKGKPQHPQNTKCWDEVDPYLVVAADKGTASFSDYANEIAEDKKFWLGDAFASGGSQGYDHKEMGITAKGAWESVKRHFWELNLNIQKEGISAIGIGDMSGDVFGNGMLLSNKMRLIAAFNHKHIFIDPNPDPAKSFRERKRLFKERLGWDGYDQKKISRGGGVFERKAKVVTVSVEVKKLYDLPSQKVKPEDLMRAILKSDVDLLWLGGIGTYVKSKVESNADVGDRSNDGVRVNASELKCKVIGEGANLGVTQRGRIEFADAGGAINTDAIDNSGGVDCSDHEVNIKILLREAMMSKELSLDERNKLLVEMTQEVSNHVLKTNYNQNLAISLIRKQGVRVLDAQAHLMRSLEKSGRLDRMLEALPDETAMAEYQISQTYLTRPEISVLLPFAKNAIYDSIIETNLPDEARLSHFLYSYFPQPLQERFKKYIARHPLKRELVATKVVNNIINRMGASFVSDLEEKLGRREDDILRAYFIALEVYGLDESWQLIEELGKKTDATHQVEALLKLWALIKRVTIWLLRNNPGPMNMDELVQSFKPAVEELTEMLEACIFGEVREKLESDYMNYQALGLPAALSKRLAKLEIVASSPDIIEISNQTKAPVSFVASLYFAVASRFGFTWLRTQAGLLRSNNAWHRMAVNSLVEDLYMYQANLTKKVLDDVLVSDRKAGKKGAVVIKQWVKDHAGDVAIFDQLLSDSRSMEVPDLALLSVVQREIRRLSE